MHEHEDKHHDHGNCCGGSCKQKCRNSSHGHHTIGGGIWFIGWLFTIGYLHLSFWYGVLALIVWPYFLGVHFAV